jgi:hypothetical protein
MKPMCFNRGRIVEYLYLSWETIVIQQLHLGLQRTQEKQHIVVGPDP